MTTGKQHPKLTTAFRNQVIAMPAGATLTTAHAKQWIALNLPTLGAPGQTQFTAEASCRCASQRLIRDGWLVRVGACNVYKRTRKAAREPVVVKAA
jgi:hypothetical protein